MVAGRTPLQAAEGGVERHGQCVIENAEAKHPAHELAADRGERVEAEGAVLDGETRVEDHGPK